MKTFKLLQRILLIAAIVPAFFLAGCVKDDFDVPPINVPTFTLPDGATLISILDLKSRHTVMGSFDSINDNVYITGIVTGNDEFGNIYKTLVIQDETSGIEIKLNQTSLYNDYKVGQRIYVKCQGLILGDYNDLIQLGTIYGTSVGQLASALIPEHLFKDSLPGAPPTPVVVTSGAELNYNMASTLVRFQGASFAESGSTWVASGEDYTNRTLNIPGATLTVRSSAYASFANEIMPSGLGDVVAILGYYGGTYQATIRNTTDLYNFVPDNNVVLVDELFTTDPGWASYSVTSNMNWTWDATYKCMIGNNFGGDVAGEDWLFAPVADFTGMDSAFIEFRTWSKAPDAGQTEPFTVMVSNNYVAGTNPNTATWTPVYGTICPYTETWTASGPVDLTAFVGQVVTIAWRYRASGTGSGTSSKWELDGVKIRAKAS